MRGSMARALIKAVEAHEGMIDARLDDFYTAAGKAAVSSAEIQKRGWM